MRKIIFLFGLVTGFLFSTAQRSHLPASSVYTRLGAYSKVHTDVFSTRANQAALAHIQSFTAGVYSERKFLLQELALYQASIAVPTPTGTFGATGIYLGNTAYNEAQAGLAYGRSLGNKISIGAQFNYYSFHVRGYGNASAINAEAGLLFHFSEQLHAGIHIYNPTGSKWSKVGEEKIPAVYSAGIGFDASDQFHFFTELQKAVGENIYVNAGLQYRMGEHLLARGGFTTATSAWFIGLGAQWKNMRLDATASMHPQLGLTPGLLLIFKKQDNIQ